MANQLKITVLKKEIYQDLADEYAADKAFPVCPRFEVGQEFILDSHNCPEGFCSWAWADLQRDVVAVYNGASFPWIKEKGMIISACTDGLRPVIFKIEKI